MTSEILIALITALVTLGAVYLTNEANLKKLLLEKNIQDEQKQKEILREKLEELYCLTKAFVSGHFSNWSPYYSVMMGDLEYNDALELTIKHFEKNKYDFNRIEMLVDLYFNSLKNNYNELIGARDSVNKIQTAHKREYTKGNIEGISFAKQFLDEQKLFLNKSNVFLSELTKIKIMV